MSRKTWVIPISSVSTPQNGVTGGSRLGSGARLGGIPRRRRGTRSSESAPPRIVRPGRTLVFSYLLGPFGACATPSGRSSPLWLLLGILFAAAGALALAKSAEIEPALRRGSGYGVFWLALALGAVCGIAAVWARSVYLGGRDAAPSAHRLSPAATMPWLVGFLGSFLPGLGLHLVGFSRRASGAILGIGGLVAGLLVLRHAGLLWNWNRISRYGVVPERILELILILAGLLAVTGVLVWLVQALDGIRLAQRKAGHERGDHSDGFALALLACSILFIALFRPALWAMELDARAGEAQALGLRYVPVGLAEAARRLDPSRPDYALRAASLHASVGATGRAQAIRDQLEEGWTLYRAGSPASVFPARGSDLRFSDTYQPDTRFILSGPLTPAPPDSL